MTRGDLCQQRHLSLCQHLTTLRVICVFKALSETSYWIFHHRKEEKCSNVAETVDVLVDCGEGLSQVFCPLQHQVPPFIRLNYSHMGESSHQLMSFSEKLSMCVNSECNSLFMLSTYLFYWIFNAVLQEEFPQDIKRQMITIRSVLLLSRSIFQTLCCSLSMAMMNAFYKASWPESTRL